MLRWRKQVPNAARQLDHLNICIEIQLQDIEVTSCLAAPGRSLRHLSMQCEVPIARLTGHGSKPQAECSSVAINDVTDCIAVMESMGSIADIGVEFKRSDGMLGVGF